MAREYEIIGINKDAMVPERRFKTLSEALANCQNAGDQVLEFEDGDYVALCDQNDVRQELVQGTKTVRRSLVEMLDCIINSRH